jgi:hypothetical protein
LSPSHLAGCTIVAGLAGAVIGSVAVHLYYATTSPVMLYDGQYGMVFMLTFPIGWLVAAGAYGVWLFREPEIDYPFAAGSVFVATYVGGLVVMPLVAPLAMAALLAAFEHVVHYARGR